MGEIIKSDESYKSVELSGSDFETGYQNFVNSYGDKIAQISEAEKFENAAELPASKPKFEIRSVELPIEDRLILKQKVAISSLFQTLREMSDADQRAPEQIIRRGSVRERLNMAQDNFLIGFRLHLMVLSKSKLIELDQDKLLVQECIQEIDEMIEKKKKIVSESEQNGDSPEEKFIKLREQRILDISRLAVIMKLTEDIVQTAAVAHGVDFHTLDLTPYSE